MPALITDKVATTTEIVLSEYKVSTEFKVTEVHESIQNRFVRAELELGPFVTRQDGPDRTEEVGTGRRSMVVWSNEEYDAIRDIWTNGTLLARIVELLG